MMQSAEIRQHFLDFFKSKAHQVVSSAPIVIKNDPTLLFTNAGMNQFKEYFLGNKPAPFSRVADTQKCLRVSGKHNDLEEVGVDTYHHTMFEMLGNWSFGNAGGEPPPYFKKEAIAWSWELLTKIYKIAPEDLYVTVFEGDDREGLPRDEESLEFWKQWISEDRIVFGNKADNFWEMGDTGPCGPCTEIHVDCRTEKEKKQVRGKDLVNHDDPQVIEIWNIVFIQHNRKKDGSLEWLPASHVDTGMGFERLVRVLQNKRSNYDTDIFTGTLAEIEKISGKKYDYTDSRQAVAFRVIADHIRAIAFPVADGQLPSNTGAGYVIRRILRRAVRYYFSYLDVKQPLLYKLIPVLAEQFSNVFPELEQQKDFVSRVIHEEENNFLRTLEAGLKRLSLVLSEKKDLDGRTAFELYDTYGFPIDLTRLIVAENSLSVDEAGFETEMQQQKERSRAASAVDTEDWTVIGEKEGKGFVGYQNLVSESEVLKYRKSRIKGKDIFQLVLDTTPFYAESGGQVGDTGTLTFDGEEIPVINTKKENELILHFTEKLPANIKAGVAARVDAQKRQRTAVHHSATHLMHAALRKVLGTHVQQKGSLVNEEYLRFDFSHFSKMTPEEISRTEAIVNEKIRENIPVVIREMPREEALKTGAMALFGEKYAPVVRVVIMDPDYSMELCGGTHVGHTGELGIFRIVAETAVGAGLRRVEAMSGKAAEEYINRELKELQLAREQLKNPKDLARSIDALLAERDKLSRQADQLETQILSSLRNDLVSKARQAGAEKFIGEVVAVSGPDALRKLGSLVREDLPGSCILLCAATEGKAHVALFLDDALVSRGLDAVKIIREQVAPLIKGGGGGQKTFAAAGGQDATKFKEVIEKVQALL
jgi:alanyl-tRNA synthetase